MRSYIIQRLQLYKLAPADLLSSSAVLEHARYSNSLLNSVVVKSTADATTKGAPIKTAVQAQIFANAEMMLFMINQAMFNFDARCANFNAASVVFQSSK